MGRCTNKTDAATLTCHERALIHRDADNNCTTLDAIYFAGNITGLCNTPYGGLLRRTAP